METLQDSVDEAQEAVEIQVEVIYYQHFSAAAKELAVDEDMKALEASPSQDTLNQYNALARELLPDVKVVPQATKSEKEREDIPTSLNEESTSSSSKKSSTIPGVRTSFADMAVVSMGALVLGAIGSRFVSVSSHRRRASAYEGL